MKDKKHIKYKKHAKQMTSAVLSAVVVSSVTLPAYAASAPDGKQEVIYAMTDAGGTVTDIEVVNIFPGGEITDYGDYSAVKILNTTDKITQKKDKIRISSSADKVYYQGTMNGNEIPWNISIRYFLDGKEYSASEIAGKSGALEIHFSVSENTNCSGDFYENYALQASFTMDSQKCTDISADGATLANVGSEKQISYTILPGKGIDAVIKAAVSDFEMAAVSINGIQLNLNVEIEDEKLKDKVNELVDAVERLDDGASELYDGSEQLRSGSSELQTAASALQSGNAALDEGIVALQNGLSMVQSGLDSLTMQSGTLVNGSSEFKNALTTLQTAVSSISVEEENLTQLVTASGQIKKAVTDLSTGAATLQKNLGYAQYKALMKENGLNVDELLAGNTNAVKTIKEYEELLEKIGQIPGYKEIVAQYQQSLLQAAEQMIGLLNANNAAFGGMESYLDGISKELPALTNGLTELSVQYETFDTAIAALVQGLGSMTGNLSELADAVNLLVTNYEKLDSGIGAYTDGTAQLAAGYRQVMDGVSSLANGSKELVSGSGQLYDGTAALYDGVVSLCDGAKDMADGTGEFRAETSDMNGKMEEEIDDILDTIGGNMEDPVSFVSEKNTNVDSVQFVIRTDAVEVEEMEKTEDVAPEETSFVQKFKNLFR